jgi:large subunit ribosomal protein L3
MTVGESVTVAVFAPGETVKVTGTSKGRGFQGIVKRHKAGGGPNTHGNTKHRRPGSIGAGTDPSRVIKGKRMPGQYGNARVTTQNLRLVRVIAEDNLYLIKGAVPGSKSGLVAVRVAVKKSR